MKLMYIYIYMMIFEKVSAYTFFLVRYDSEKHKNLKLKKFLYKFEKKLIKLITIN